MTSASAITAASLPKRESEGVGSAIGNANIERP